MIIKGRPIFDIIAGTSIGAINAAILVSYVVENQTCEGVHYNKVITSDHVIASGSFPVNFDFAKIEVESQISSLSSN
jgi:patatin-like phospholipase/acyl hydrolase